VPLIVLTSLFLNKLRADHFDSVVKSAHDAGVEIDARFVKSLADYINTFTGRASLGNGKFLGIGEQNAALLAQVNLLASSHCFSCQGVDGLSLTGSVGSSSYQVGSL
jgi:hypothetical protein